MKRDAWRGWNSSVYIIPSQPSGPPARPAPLLPASPSKGGRPFYHHCYFAIFHFLFWRSLGDTPCCQPGESGGRATLQTLSDARVYTRPAGLLTPHSPPVLSSTLCLLIESAGVWHCVALPVVHPTLTPLSYSPWLTVRVTLEKGTKRHLKAWTFIF